jgi:hypothetical protein
VWGIWDFEFVPYSQLVRSEEAGILPGEARHLYLAPKSAVGDGVALSWIQLLEAIKIAREAMGVVADAGGTVLALEALRRVLMRLGVGSEAINRHVNRWIQRGASFPGTLSSSLEGRAWDPERLAAVLGCNKDDAEHVLGVFGYAEDPSDCLWRRDADQPAHVLSMLLEEAYWYHGDLEVDDSSFRARVEELARTGTLAPRAEFEPDLEYPSYEDLARTERVQQATRAAALATLSFVAGMLSRRRRR